MFLPVNFAEIKRNNIEKYLERQSILEKLKEALKNPNLYFKFREYEIFNEENIEFFHRAIFTLKLNLISKLVDLEKLEKYEIFAEDIFNNMRMIEVYAEGNIKNGNIIIIKKILEYLEKKGKIGVEYFLIKSEYSRLRKKYLRSFNF